jgi:hypothetical protein
VLKISGAGKCASASSSASRVPVHDRHQIHEAVCERNVRDIRGPHVIHAIDPKPSQQVRIAHMLGRWRARLRLRGQCDDPHLLHQPLHALAVHDTPLRAQLLAQLAAPQERRCEMQLVDPPHQLELLVARRARCVVHARAMDSENLALPSDRERRVRIDHRAAFLHRTRSSPRAKKSRSTVSSPIFARSSASRSGLSLRLGVLSKASAALSSSSFFHL